MITKIGWMVLVCFAAVPALVASDLPDSQINAHSGAIEIAAPVWSGGDYDVDFVVRSADGTRNVEAVATSDANDFAPRIAGASNGDAWVVWWREGAEDSVHARARDHATGAWGAERALSVDGESSREPAVVYDGSDAWVAYEFGGGAGRSIAAIIITDEPDPIGVRSVIAETAYGAHLDVEIHTFEGHLWVTWIDSSVNLGFSEYDPTSATWTAVLYESYASDGVDEARARIRAEVTAP